MSDMAQKPPSASPAYTPQATAASERAAGSVMDRFGLPRGTRANRSRQLADRVVAGYLGDPRGAKRDEGNRPPQRNESDKAAPQRQADDDHRPAASMSVLLNYQPSEVVRAGLRMREAGSSTNPLWSVLPPAKLESIVSTLETVLSSPAGQAPAKEAAGNNAPSMTLLHSGNRERPANKRGDARQKESNEISQAAMAASAKLLEVLRAHAASRAASGDDRVTLGDLTTIAFAESNQRLAAAEHGSTPQAREPDSTSDAVPNDKLFKSPRDLLVKLQEIAKKIFKELKQEDSSADARQGQS